MPLLLSIQSNFAKKRRIMQLGMKKKGENGIVGEKYKFFCLALLVKSRGKGYEMPQDRFQCKECGTVDSTKFTLFDNAFRCNVCGSINPLYDSYNVVRHEHVGNIKVDGIASVESLLARARQYLDNSNYDNALKLYKSVLEKDATNHIAWWGCYCCEKGIAAYYRYTDKFGNSGPRVKANILAELINKYGNKAIDYAPGGYSQSYRDALKPDIQFVESVIMSGNKR